MQDDAIETLSSKDSRSVLTQAARRFFSGTMLSRITGLARDITMAFAFGTRSSVAAFLMAFRFAHLLRRLLGEGALQSAFIPHYEKLRKESPEKAGHFFIDLTGSLSVFLVFIIFLAMVMTGFLAFGNFLNSDNKEIAYNTFLMFPSLLFICLYGINAAFLQCHHSYFVPSIAPAAFNLVWIASIPFISHLPMTQAMGYLSLSVILACSAQWLLTLPFILKILNAQQARWSSISLFSQEVRSLASPLFLGIIGVAASQINNALDVVFARYADVEGPAYLWYAIRLQQLPLALFGIAISSALLPPLTRAVRNQDWKQFADFLDFAFCKTFALMFPLTVGVFLIGHEVVMLVYGYGDFSLESINHTTLCLWTYGIGLVPMALVLITAPAFYAQENFKFPMRASVLSMALNICLNTLLIMVIGWGAASIALATSFSAGANLAILLYGLHKQGFPFWTIELKRTVKRTSVACIAGTSGVLAIQFISFHSMPVQFSCKVLTFCGLFFLFICRNTLNK